MDTVVGSGTWCAVTAVIDGFSGAHKRLESWRKVKRYRKSGESELRDSLGAGCDELKVEYDKLREEYGEDFERGDEISRPSLFKIANEVHQTLIDVLARAERVKGNSSDLNYAELWQISEKTRKRAILCMCELGLRIQKKRANMASYSDNGPRLRGAALMNDVPVLYPQHSRDISERTRSVYDMPRERTYEPPSRYSMASVPEFGDVQSNWMASPPTPFFCQEPRRISQPETQSSWRIPSPETVFRMETPNDRQPDQSLPASLRIGIPDSLRTGGIPAARPFSPSQRPRPISTISSPATTGTGFLSRLATATPVSDQRILRPHSTAPVSRPAARDRSSSDFTQPAQEVRGYDTRRATVGYDRQPQFDQIFVPPVWSPPPHQQEQSWSSRHNANANTPRTYTPNSPQGDFLDVGPNGNFRMPTPVNHGGHEDDRWQ